MNRFPPRRRPDGRVGETMPLFGESPADTAPSVSVFVARMNGTLRVSHANSWVKGEVSDYKVWASGHAYFTLKDDAASLPAMMWADDVRRLTFRVEAGMAVLVRGRPDIYPKSGKLSFVVAELQPVGAGALQLAFEQLRARLAGEGLFDLSRKRPLPTLPRRIGVVTSRHGAALRDILKVLSLRFPNAHVTLYPVAVQGAFAAEEIARGVRAFTRVPVADVLVIARGGGSKEDLAAFNDERVVRAVASSAVPTISAVGHEIDITLTDLVADVRAATPSQAAELVVARREEFEGHLRSMERELSSLLRQQLNDAKAGLLSLSGARGLGGFPDRAARLGVRADSLSRQLVSSMRGLPTVYRERLQHAESEVLAWPARAGIPFKAAAVSRESRALRESLRNRLGSADDRLASLAGRLSSLDPLRILARGYAVAYRDGESTPLTEASQAAPGDTLRVVLSRGELSATVTGRKE